MIAGHLPRRVPDVKRRLREAVDRCTREHPRGRTCHLAANSWKVLKDHRKLRLTAARWAAEREWGGGGPTATISLAPMAQREPCGRATPRSSVPVVDMRIAGVGGRASCEKARCGSGHRCCPRAAGSIGIRLVRRTGQRAGVCGVDVWSCEVTLLEQLERVEARMRPSEY